jgi:hypothetical protein
MAAARVGARQRPLLGDAIQRTELVAVRIAHVGEVDVADAARAQARRVFDGHAAVSDRDIVELLDLLCVRQNMPPSCR